MRAVSAPSAVLFGMVAALAAGSGLEAQRAPFPYTSADADRFALRLAVIVEHSAPPGSGARPAGQVRTVLREPEVNAYLHERADQLPAGLARPTIVSLGEGRLAGRAEVDFDAVRQARPRGLFDPLRYLGGRVPVTISGVLHARNGVGRFDLESASVGGVPVPRRLVQEVVWYFSRSASYPDGVVLDAPFALPARIRAIDVLAGEAVITQ